MYGCVVVVVVVVVGFVVVVVVVLVVVAARWLDLMSVGVNNIIFKLLLPNVFLFGLGGLAVGCNLASTS